MNYYNLEENSYYNKLIIKEVLRLQKNDNK